MSPPTMTATSPETERQIEEILRRPYRKIISGDPEEGFLIQVPDLPGCMTAGETEAEAIANLPEAMAVWLESALDHGDPIPEPTPERYAGRVLVRMPRSLHRRLAAQARAEGVSLNQWVVTLLARGWNERTA
jgi:antitoxin HicB